VFDAVLEAGVRGLWLFLTGTGRCGTGYMAQVLTSVGVNCTHEGVFHPHWERHPGCPSEEELRRRVRLNQENAWWGWQAESSWLAAPYLEIPEMRGCTVVHLLRHPKKVIDSQMRIRAFSGGHSKFHDFQLQFLPEMAGMEPLHQAAYFYVKWNRMIEPHAQYRHRVDKDSTLRLLDLLGIEWSDKEVYQNTRYNSRAGWGQYDADLDGLPEPLRGELREMCEGYGYDWPTPPSPPTPLPEGEGSRRGESRRGDNHGSA
jgi:hypothetical protein